MNHIEAMVAVSQGKPIRGPDGYLYMKDCDGSLSRRTYNGPWERAFDGEYEICEWEANNVKNLGRIELLAKEVLRLIDYINIDAKIQCRCQCQCPCPCHDHSIGSGARDEIKMIFNRYIKEAYNEI